MCVSEKNIVKKKHLFIHVIVFIWPLSGTQKTELRRNNTASSQTILKSETLLLKINQCVRLQLTDFICLNLRLIKKKNSLKSRLCFLISLWNSPVGRNWEMFWIVKNPRNPAVIIILLFFSNNVDNRSGLKNWVCLTKGMKNACKMLLFSLMTSFRTRQRKKKNEKNIVNNIRTRQLFIKQLIKGTL